MTAPTRRPQVTGEAEADRLLRRGMKTTDVAELTDVPLERVQQIRQQIAATVTPRPDTMPARPRPVPAPPATVERMAAGPEPLPPVPDSAYPPGSTALLVETDTVQQLLAQVGAGGYGKRAANLAARIAGDIDRLRQQVTDHERRAAEKAKQEHARLEALAEVERLQKRLQAAKAKAGITRAPAQLSEAQREQRRQSLQKAREARWAKARAGKDQAS